VSFKRALLGLVLFCGLAQAQAASHGHPRLVLAAQSARPGDEIMAGVHFKLDPGWHIFWKNPGQPSLPTTVEWTLPAGVTAGEIQWPVPKKHVDRDEAISFSATTYIYEDEVVLLVPLKVAENAAAGLSEITVKIEWQECEKLCVNADAEIHASFEIATDRKPAKDAPLLAAWQKRLPKRDPNLAVRAVWEKAAAGDVRPLILEWNSSSPGGQADFFPNTNDSFEIQPETQKLRASAGQAKLRIQLKKTSGDWPKQFAGVLVEGSGAGQVGYEVNPPVSEPAPGSVASGAPETFAGGEPTLLQMLLFAFLGGLILNVMPCVLPVIALKILGFVKDAHNEPRKVRKLGVIYSAGVLVSFFGLALITLGLKAAGEAAGWGFQFGNPYFIVAMTVLVTLIALNLFGVFEVTLSSSALGAANQFAGREGAVGAFFNGLLATVLATSCSAPILAQAIGFASSLKSSVGLVLFWLTVGVGLAAPYLVLSFQPAWLRFLPKPGPWMNRFKVAMGFPMIGAVVWLCSAAAVHYGDRTWWMVAFLVFVAVAAWVYGEFVQRGTKHKGIAVAATILLLIAGYVLALERQLEWRKPLTGLATNSATRGVHPRGLEWEPWSLEAVAAARAASRPVIVDFTANWCLNCNLVVKPTLESASVQKKLRDVNAVLLVADYSVPKLTPEITEELQRFKRDGVPLVLVYPCKSSSPPLVFDLPSSRTLVKALDQAARP
jgi:thiol:disulfide interchange protein DsbD